ncbi:MAG: NAD(P)-dependent oxidoreductase [Betaproteobacteria bacterium]|nr:NAD(P)-dependent oxidoreductase [Betaproteobacteria bacterium]
MYCGRLTAPCQTGDWEPAVKSENFFGDNAMAKISFLGLGVMGYPMAGHLLKKGGHELTVYNRSAAKAAQWVKEYGGKSAPTPREAAQGADFVLMCVGNDDDVRSVAYGDNGAMAGLKKGAILVDHTTASAVLARDLYKETKSRGVGFVDAPVSGGQAGAVNGQLGIMCGGDQADYDKALPVLNVYAKMCALIGGAGAGQLTKMVNQVAIVGLLQGLSEALSFGLKAGLDMEKVISVISKGAAQSWQMDNRWKTMAAGKFEGFGFAADWMRKDLNIALAEAKKNGAHMPGTALIEQYYGRISAAGHGRWDNTAIMGLLKD